LLPVADDLAHDLRIEAVALRLGIDFTDIGGEPGFLFLQAFHPFDESAKLLAGNAAAVVADVTHRYCSFIRSICSHCFGVRMSMSSHWTKRRVMSSTKFRSHV